MIPGLGRPPGDEGGNPLQCFWLDRGPGGLYIHGVTKSLTQPSTDKQVSRDPGDSFTKMLLVASLALQHKGGHCGALHYCSIETISVTKELTIR